MDAGFNVGRFVNSKFWPVVSQITQYVSGEQSWYPYDVACNLIRSADHTRCHLDTSDDNEKEMTFLLYLSPNWTASDQGETAFTEYNHDTLDNDYVAEVVPLYGRAVIFDGNFPHSARPQWSALHIRREIVTNKTGDDQKNLPRGIKAQSAERRRHDETIPIDSGKICDRTENLRCVAVPVNSGSATTT